MRILRWVLISLVVTIALVGCSSEEPAEVPMDATPESVNGTVQPTSTPLPAGKTVVADGRLDSPYPGLGLGFGGEASGRVLTITVEAGDTVQAGDLLALLDDTDLQRAVDEAQLALDRAIADRDRALEQWERDVADAEQAVEEAERALAIARLEYTDTSVEQARTDLDRARQGEKDRKWEYDQALKAWPPVRTDLYYDAWQRAIRDRELAEMRLADAEDTHQADYLELNDLQEEVVQAERELAALEQGIEPTYERAIEDAERELDQAQETLTRARLTAPWRAIVLSVDVAPGASVGPETPVVTLVNVEEGLLFVTHNLNEQHIAHVYPGQRAVVTLRTFPQIPLEGTVEAVVPQLEEGEELDSGARFTVHVRLSPEPSSTAGRSLRLLPGLTGRVEIFTTP